ncbi:MAG: sigma-54 dependent transcriptional regulator [Mariprofundaceae bacterium]
MADILLVEDEANARQVLSIGLEARGHQVVSYSNPDDAKKALREQSFDVVLTDLRMHGQDGGLEVVRASAVLQPDAQVLLLTAYASAETAVQAMRDGAFDYLTKPVSADELAEAIERALEQNGTETVTASEAMQDELLIGDSIVMQKVKERLVRAASREFTVLVTGESGTGKELAARFVHQHSKFSLGPFVPVHCGAIPETLFESELFGHKKGSFTGADSDRVGLIESADGGTLFLDEVGEMPLPIQVKLLRVLQDMKIRRVGEEHERQVHVRIVAATNRDLEAEVKQGLFREDLFYRLNVIPVHMPALRQRREDIPKLIHSLLQRWGESRVELSSPCLKRLSQLPLLGNVRELENLLQRMIALSDDDVLDDAILDDLYPASHGCADISLESMQKQGQNLEQLLDGVERDLLAEAMLESGGNATQAAKLLGINFRSMRYRLDKLGMKNG